MYISNFVKNRQDTIKNLLSRLSRKNFYLLYKKLTIRSKIVISFIVIIVLFVNLNLSFMIKSLNFNRQYDKFVNNITLANTVNSSFKTNIDNEMWNIVAGKTEFYTGKQYEIIEYNVSNINYIKENVSTIDNKVRLEVLLRTIDTLIKYIDRMGQNIKDKKTVDENIEVLENIRGVTSLIEDDIQEYMIFELQEIDKLNKEIQKSHDSWIVTSVYVLCIVLVFSILAVWIISGNISKPIDRLCKSTASISEGNFNVRVDESNSSNEIEILVKSFNTMVIKVKELMEKSVEEQKHIKKSELKVLQAQIKPHFLYNTLDTIVWMADSGQKEQVKKLVKALSVFFRLSLSKGKDFITIEKEVEHIESYLTIQKIRYRDILNYKISVDKNIYNYKVLNLTLQPLIENAIYHGIKYKRTGGFLKVNGFLKENKIIFEIIDNGQGMTKEKLLEVKENLNNENDLEIKETGFGINNVHKRIQLYYGKIYGLNIISEFNKGTKVLVCIPLKE